MQLCKSYSYKM